jgi:hypothetical protein
MGVTSHAPGSVGKCEGMNPHTSKGASTLGVRVPMDSWIFKEWLQGSKFNGVKSSLYHWKKFRTWMSKMGSHDPFGHLKHKLWPREGPGIKLAIWLLTIKVRNHFYFLMCRWCATYRWKALDEGYNFSSDRISIRGLHAKLWACKVARDPIVRISGLPLGSLGTKCHLDVGLMERHKVYYKGEGGGFPQVQAVVSLVSLSLPMIHLNTKSAPTMH